MSLSFSQNYYFFSILPSWCEFKPMASSHSGHCRFLLTAYALWNTICFLCSDFYNQCCISDSPGFQLHHPSCEGLGKRAFYCQGIWTLEKQKVSCMLGFLFSSSAFIFWLKVGKSLLPHMEACCSRAVFISSTYVCIVQANAVAGKSKQQWSSVKTCSV